MWCGGRGGPEGSSSSSSSTGVHTNTNPRLLRPVPLLRRRPLDQRSSGIGEEGGAPRLLRLGPGVGVGPAHADAPARADGRGRGRRGGLVATAVAASFAGRLLLLFIYRRCVYGLSISRAELALTHPYTYIFFPKPYLRIRPLLPSPPPAPMPMLVRGMTPRPIPPQPRSAPFSCSLPLPLPPLPPPAPAPLGGPGIKAVVAPEGVAHDAGVALRGAEEARAVVAGEGLDAVLHLHQGAVLFVLCWWWLGGVVGWSVLCKS